MSTIEAMNQFQQHPSVRLVAQSNQSGTYNNGPTNNGVGATFTYATGSLTIDSVVVAQGDFILLAGQTAAYQNGIYQCVQAGATGVAAVLQRRGDFQSREQVRGGHYIPVSAGTVYGGSVWTVVEPLPGGIGLPNVSGANNINLSTITAAGSSLYLQVANNLSDVASLATTQSNLGLTGIVASGLNYASVALTLSQFQNMYTTPVQIVAAPGSGKIIRLANAMIYQTYGSAQLAGGGVVAFQYGNAAHGAGPYASNQEQASDFTGAAANQNYWFVGASGNASNTADQSNAGIFLSNQSAVWTGGTGGSFEAHVWYYTVATP